jgi:hypothetical protein
MAESDEFFKAAVVACRTIRRLERHGQSPSDARSLVKAIVDAEERLVVQQGYPFDADRFIRRLHHLANEA